MKIKVVRARGGRRIPGFSLYWKPRRLTMQHNPPIYAWLWWKILVEHSEETRHVISN